MPSKIANYLFTAFIFFHITTFPLTFDQALTRIKTNYKKLALKSLQVASKISGAFGLALACHILSEAPIVFSHELGHEVGQFLTDGTWISIKIAPNFKDAPLSSLAVPFRGISSIMHDSNKNELLFRLMGPIGGIAAGYGTIIAAGAIKALIEQESVQDGIKKGALAPAILFQSLTEKTKNFILALAKKEQPKEISFGECLFWHFVFLKTARTIGETLYGLCPIEMDEFDTDGAAFWDNITNTKLKLSFGTLIFCAGIPSYIALGVGILQAIIKIVKENKKLIMKRKTKI